MKAIEVRNDTMSMSLTHPASIKKKPMRQRRMPLTIPSHQYFARRPAAAPMKASMPQKNENNRQEVWEYQFGKDDTSNEHKAYKHVDHTTGYPPAPTTSMVGPGSHAKLDNTGKDKKPAENLRGDGINLLRARTNK